VVAGAGRGAGASAHIDVLGSFAAQVAGGQSLTRVLLPDVMVLKSDRAGSSVALTLEVSQASALLLQEAQALGMRTFVDICSVGAPSGSAAVVSSVSDADLAARLAGQTSGTAPANVH
jgi:hypothetical protein